MQRIDTEVRTFVYYTNFILRNVILANSVGTIHDGRSLSQWLIENGFRSTFSLSSQQVLKIDLSLLSKQQTQAIVGMNPFDGLNLQGIERALEILNLATDCVIIAIPTASHSEVRPKVVYAINEWKQILRQIGPVVEIAHTEQNSIFLVTRHG